MSLRRKFRAVLPVFAVALVPAMAGGVAAAGGSAPVAAATPRATPHTIMSEGFEGFFPGAGWTVLDGDGAAMGEYYWDDAAAKPHYGLWSAWAAKGGANGLDPATSPYPNYMDSWMRYGPFDLRPYSAAHLEFWYWNQSEEGYDPLFWGAAPDGNSFVGTSVSGNSGGWVQVDLDLSGHLGDDSVWVAWRFTSDGDTQGVGPFVDDIVLSGTPAWPSAFDKTYPLDGAGPLAKDTTLAWSSATYATVYQYCADTIDNDACDDAWVEVGSSTSTSAMGLDYSHTYYWQVRAINDFGVSYANGGNWWSFTTAAPTILEGAFRSIGGNDGWTLEHDEASGKGGSRDATADRIRVGDDASDRQYRGILSFDTASLPDDAVVTGVTLRVRKQGVAGSNPIGTHGYLIVDMRTGFFHDIQALERFDFHAAGSRGNVGRFVKTPDQGWYRAPLRAAAYPLVNLMGTTQFRLRFETDDNDDEAADYLSLYSGEVVNDASRPELIIRYYVP